MLPPNHPAVQGKAAIRDLWQGVLASGVVDWRSTPRTIEVSGDLAYGVRRYVMQIETGRRPAHGAKGEVLRRLPPREAATGKG